MSIKVDTDFKDFDKTVSKFYKDLLNLAFSDKDANKLRDDIVKAAKEGNTGFTFRNDYSKAYLKRKGTSEKMYSGKAGKGAHMLDKFKVKVIRENTKVSLALVITDKDKQLLEEYHRDGNTKSRKVRQWMGINDKNEKLLQKTFRIKYNKLLKSINR